VGSVRNPAANPAWAGAVSRIPAAEIEGLVVRSVRDHLNQSEEIEDAVLITTHVARIEIQSDQLIELTNAGKTGWTAALLPSRGSVIIDEALR
jgi:hypothetical protein